MGDNRNEQDQDFEGGQDQERNQGVDNQQNQQNREQGMGQQDRQPGEAGDRPGGDPTRMEQDEDEDGNRIDR